MAGLKFMTPSDNGVITRFDAAKENVAVLTANAKTRFRDHSQ